jgi:hypothetical protein
MELVLNAIKEVINLRKSRARVVAHSYANPHIVNAYVSYFPRGDPSEETIDFSIILKLQAENRINFECDICRSNGEILSEIISKVIQVTSREDLLEQVNDLSKEAVAQVLVRMKEMDL